MTKHNIILPFLLLPLVMLFHACAIKDDIPYPIVESVVTAFEIEGQCNDTDDGEAEAVIDKKAQTVTVNVSDRVDLSALHILRFEASNDAQILPAPEGATFDFSSGTLPFTLRTYQDYDWKVNVSQIILRDVQMQGQVGDAVIDDYSRNVVVRVSADQDLHNIKVDKFSLAGQHGRVVPDPTASATYDFSEPRVFDAISAATGKAEQWTVYVYQTTAVEPLTVNVFMRSVSAVVSGSKPTGTTPVVEYRKQGDADWKTVPAGNVVSTARAYIAEATGLTPAVSYEFRVTAGSTTTETPQAQPTVAAQQLENGSFDNWSISGSGNNALYQPWGEGENSYWDTGNKGATTVGASNSTYVDEGGRRFANLQSKYIVIKFAAGNIFTGNYLKTDGSNGVLSFGRPFASFPTKLRFEYKYKTSTINKSAAWNAAYADYIPKSLFDGLIGQPDSCCVYIALGDWEPEEYNGEKCPYLIKTRPSDLHLFDPKDSHVIAYGQMTKGVDVSTWTTETITLNYRVTNRQPKYIIVVASSSKYGDYFAGGEGSLLQIDNMELLYE